MATSDQGKTVKSRQALVTSQSQFATFSGNPKSPAICPVDAIISEIGLMDLGHPSGVKPAIKIKPQNLNSTATFEKLATWQHESADKLIQRIEDAGIVGLGGAMFPTAQKLRYGGSKIKTLIVNGMECEPYITCDDQLMQQHSNDILIGSQISAFISHAEEIIIGIEDNKPQAIQALTDAIQSLRQQNQLTYPIRILVVPTKYPSGGEKQLIQLTTGKEVPSGHFPASLGLLVQNVATLFSIKKAVIDGQALTHRLVTITGQGVSPTGNYWIAIGTPIQFIVDELSIEADFNKGVVVGGPLMGQRVFNLVIPIQAASNCLIFNLDSANQSTIRECIRCTLCQQACPINLLPQELYWQAKAEQLESLQRLNLFDCIECGA
ncbi:MAG: electron transport complex subunit RsxC [Enterobacterales bacterium]|nr:electron transport complex subunit RsxC [Enterobacterales bacterium]